jgi:hypothetical protein
LTHLEIMFMFIQKVLQLDKKEFTSKLDSLICMKLLITMLENL